MTGSLAFRMGIFHKNQPKKPSFHYDILDEDKPRPGAMCFDRCERNISMCETKDRLTLMIFHDPDCPTYKYIIGTTIKLKKLMVILPMSEFEGHRKILDHLKKDFGIRFLFVRGGQMTVQNGKIDVYGGSSTCGRADHVRAAGIMRSFLGEGSGFSFACASKRRQ